MILCRMFTLALVLPQDEVEILNTMNRASLYLRLLCLGALYFLTHSSHGQNTVGLLSYDPAASFDGYNLLYPHRQPNVYLLDNCGEIVHTWEGDPETVPGNTAYIAPNGLLVKTLRPASVTSDRILAGGAGATVEIRDWDNNLVWEYTVNDSLRRLHHDIALVEKEDNTFNILMIAWEYIDTDEVLAAGRDTTGHTANVVWSDYIFEIDPLTNEIVWEWHAWDHLVQDHDSRKQNFGNIADAPGRIDINLDFSEEGHPDWLHANSIDYDPINDYVLLSVPHFSEVWIIDHTTTTEQARTGQGGFGGKGGDLLYRWGNPQAYGVGDESDRTLFFQHDARFIDDFIDPFDPNYGKISFFNNRVGSDYSAFGIFDQGFDMYEWSFPFDGEKYGPEVADFVGTFPGDRTQLFSSGLSSFQYLPNRNMLVCSGRLGYTFELTPDNEIVWEYKTPIIGGRPATQGDELAMNVNLTFRLYRYPIDYPAFTDRDLSSKGFIEIGSDTSFCDRILPVQDLEEVYGMKLYPNPVDDMLTVEWDARYEVSVDILDIHGRLALPSRILNGGRRYLDTSHLRDGIYIIRINARDAGRFIISR